ncbi:2653_t:CDS:2, partial [Acaulospora morrowiae]
AVAVCDRDLINQMNQSILNIPLPPVIKGLLATNAEKTNRIVYQLYRQDRSTKITAYKDAERHLLELT